MELGVETAGALSPDVFFDDVRVEHTGSLIVQEQHQYAFGAPLPGLSYAVGSIRYRHGYQGQYAEQDAETGFESFELQLYNSRIGRWTAPDPYGQFDSPYVGMGNNPVSGTDPDGGWFCGDCVGSTLTGVNALKGVAITGTSVVDAFVRIGINYSAVSLFQVGGDWKIYSNEKEAYRNIYNRSKGGLEHGGLIVHDAQGKQFVFEAPNDGTYNSFDFYEGYTYPTSYVKNNSKGTHPVFVHHKISYEIDAYLHIHPPGRNYGGYEGPSGYKDAYRNVGPKRGGGDLGWYYATKRTQFIIGPTQVSELNPNKEFILNYGKNEHQIFKTEDLFNDNNKASLFKRVRK